MQEKRKDNPKDEIEIPGNPQSWDKKIKLIISFGSFLAMFSMSVTNVRPFRFGC